MKADNVEFTVSNVVSTLPKDVFRPNNTRAAVTVVKTLIQLGISAVLLQLVPWYALPAAWLAASLAMTSMFAVAHDCGHDVFFTSPFLNWLVGTIFLSPFFYPFQAWKLHHDYHHAHPAKSKRKLSAQSSKSIWRLVNPLFWPYDIASIVLLYYDLSRFEEKDRAKARLSVYVTYGTIALFFPLTINYFGVWALVKMWFAPWIIFHFWKNSLRQALPAVSLSYPHSQKSNKYKALATPSDDVDESIRRELLNELTHFRFPTVFEWMCHGINYQVPHYLSQKIPVYNLADAHQALMSGPWKSKIHTFKFGWGLLSSGNILQSSSTTQQTLEELYKANTIQELRTQLSDLGIAFRPEAGKATLANQLYEELRERNQLPLTESQTTKPSHPFKRSINWVHFPLFTFTHAAALYGLLFVPYTAKTLIWAVIYYYMTGLGITAGYHRLWSHRAYEATFPIRFVLMCWGSGAVEGSIKWWSAGHRVHHRFTDTDDDPYNSKRGFFYAHMGWMLWKEDKGKRAPRVPIDDLVADPLVRIQHTLYPVFAGFFGFVFPALVASFWGDGYAGFFWAGVIRLCFVHHATFCVNSLAHYAGSQPFADTHTPKDSFFTALMTMGEGYHNFHHEFPKDYRNAIRWYQYDPTKWLVRVLAFLGFTYNLKVFPENEIRKGQIQMQEKAIHQRADELDWGASVETLPLMTMEDVKARTQKGDMLIVIGGIVHDVKEWFDDHPGGSSLLKAFIGKDATKAFNGGVYNHSNAGRNLLTALRVGRLEDHVHGEALPDERYEVTFAHTPAKVE